MQPPKALDAKCGECLVFGALHGLTDGLVLIDPEGRIFHANRRAEEILGLVAVQVLGTRLVAHLKHPGLAAFWYSAAEEMVPATTELAFSSGTTIRATVSICLSAGADPIGKALLLCDVTREKRINVELSASLARRLMEMAGGQAPQAEVPKLTRREREILRLLADGLTNAAIATKLSVSVNTVASHLKHLYPKISVNSRSQAAAYAVTHGIYQSEE
jgi:PAS domain S-box-containing protein